MFSATTAAASSDRFRFRNKFKAVPTFTLSFHWFAIEAEVVGVLRKLDEVAELGACDGWNRCRSHKMCWKAVASPRMAACHNIRNNKARRETILEVGAHDTRR